MKNFLRTHSNIWYILVVSAISCTTAKGSNVQGNSGKKLISSKLNNVTQSPISSQNPSAGLPQNAEPPKVQPQYQNEFARELVKAGSQSEGWALFSDSSMGHNGQRWIIKSTQGKTQTITLCVLLQQDKECKTTTMSEKQFNAISPVLKKGEKLSHILPTTYDALTFEFLHARNSSPKTDRVVFISSDKPFPAEYEDLIKAFN